MGNKNCFTIRESAMRRASRKPEINTTIDLANWMGNLNDTKRNTSITFLAIPGSHDSMTYGITKASKISPDAENIVKELAKYLKPFVKLIIYHWSVTQRKNVLKQLNLGVRYFDLRVAVKEDDQSNFYFVHGMYGQKIDTGLADIVKFLNEHEKEAVILDFQHFYNFSYSDHQRLVEELINAFGHKLCPQPGNVNSVTLNWMTENNYQVIAIYRNNFSSARTFLWPSNLWPTPWPDTMNISELLEYLQDRLAIRSKSVGFVSQCVLTPQTSTVVLNPFSNIMKKCAKPVFMDIIPWIQEQRPPINVAIADFIDMNNANFPLSVVSLNYSELE